MVCDAPTANMAEANSAGKRSAGRAKKERI